MTDTQERGLVVVAEATRYPGRNVVQVLCEDGWAVRALARDCARLEYADQYRADVLVEEGT